MATNEIGEVKSTKETGLANGLSQFLGWLGGWRRQRRAQNTVGLNRQLSFEALEERRVFSIENPLNLGAELSPAWTEPAMDVAGLRLQAVYNNVAAHLEQAKLPYKLASLAVRVGANPDSTAHGLQAETRRPPAETPTKTPRFFVVDDRTDSVFAYAADGEPGLANELASGDNRSRGIASNPSGDTQWVIDADRHVSIYDGAGERLGRWRAEGLVRPEDIAVEGEDLWVVDAGRNRVVRYLGAASRRDGGQTGVVEFELASGNGHATGLFVRDGRVWVTDDSADKVFVYSTTGERLGQWKLDDANRDPSGITLATDGSDSIWVVDRRDAEVYHYAHADAWISGQRAATDSFLLAEGNEHPEGIADPDPGYQIYWYSENYWNEGSWAPVGTIVGGAGSLQLRFSGSATLGVDYVLGDPTTNQEYAIQEMEEEGVTVKYLDVQVPSSGYVVIWAKLFLDNVADYNEFFQINPAPGTGTGHGYVYIDPSYPQPTFSPNSVGEQQPMGGGGGCLTCEPVTNSADHQTGTKGTAARAGGAAYLVNGGSTNSPNPHPIVTVETQFNNFLLNLPDKFEVTLTFGGITGSPVWYDADDLVRGDKLRFTMQADATTLASGRYDWSMEVKSHFGSTVETTSFTGSQNVVNRTQSEFGNQWWLEGLDRLHLSSAGALLVNGDNTALWYQDLGWNGEYIPPQGDLTFSSLKKTGSGASALYTLTAKDKSKRIFNFQGLLTKRVDSNGNEITYTYTDADGDTVSDEIYRLTTPGGRITEYGYTAGYLSSVTDPTGNVTTIARDSSHRVASITLPDPDGAGPQAATVSSFTYDATSGRIATLTDAGGMTSTFTYDFAGRLDTASLPCGCSASELDPLQTVGLVDTTGGLGSSTNPADLFRTTDAAARHEDLLGNETLTKMDRFGNVIEEVDALGNVTKYERNQHGLVTKLTLPDPDGAGSLSPSVYEYTYNSKGNMLTAKHPGGATETWFYNINNFVTSYTDQLGKKTQYTVDPYGNVLAVTQVVGFEDTVYGDSDDLVTTFTYTVGTGGIPKGLVATMTDPLGRITSYTYDSTGDVTRVTYAVGTADEAHTDYEYDAADNMTASIDELGRRTEYDYDALDRLIRITLPDPDTGDSNPAPEIEYEYDALNRLTKEVDELGRVTTYTYENYGRRTVVTTPDHDANGQLTVTKFNRDYVGNTTSVIDPLGRTTSYSYDALNRLATVTAPDPDGAGVLTSGVTTYFYDAASRLTKVRDALNNDTQFAYDQRNRLTSSTNDLAGVVGSTYDAVGNVLTSTDELGRVTSYQYDDLHRLIKVTSPDPDGAGTQTASVTEYTYDKASNLATTKDALGNITTFTYDARNRLKTVTTPDPDGAGAQTASVTTYAYNAASELVSETDALGRVTAFAYDGLGRLKQLTEADPDGAGPLTNPVTTYKYDDAGNLLETTDALGNKTAYAYDAHNNLIQVTGADPDGVGGPLTAPVSTMSYDAAGQLLTTTDPLGRTTSYLYDDLGRVTSVTSPDPDGAGPQAAPVSTFTYDKVGNVVTATDPMGRVTTYAYDDLYRQTSVTQADPDGGGPLSSPVTTYAYDAAGQLTSVTDPLNRATTFAYDNLGRQTTVTSPDPDGAGALLPSVATYAYDKLGNVLSVTNALEFATTYLYDNLSRRIRETDANGDYTQFEYDKVGNLTKLTDPLSNDTIWTYDNLDRRITETNELSEIRSFEYDLVGNLTKKTDRRGWTTEYAYDDLYRPTTETWKQGTTVVNSIETAYDTGGQLTSIADDFGAYAFTYDNLGRLTTEDNNGSPGPRVVLAHTYDANSNRTKLEVDAQGGAAGDFTNDYVYDHLSRLTQAKQSGSGVAEKRVDIAYNAAGQETTLQRYANAAGTQTSSAYDNAGRLTALTHSKGSTITGYAWAYDAANRVTSYASTADGTSTFTYDNRDQLAGADHNFQSDEAYTYDDNGNRTMSGYTTGTNNQVTTDGTYTYTYDDEGNRLLRTKTSDSSVTEYEWDHRNRLTRVVFRASSGGAITKEVTYSYDAFDRRISKVVDADGAGAGAATAERFVYDGVDIALVYDGEGLINRYFHDPRVMDDVWADEQFVSGVFDETLWSLDDNQDTVRDLVRYSEGTDTTSVENHLKYDAFGRISHESDASETPRQSYTGRELDEEVGLYYFRARYYDDFLGTFINEDPIGFAASDANLHRYVENSPTNFTDQTGLAGDGHHIVGKKFWGMFHQDARLVFDRAASRIHDDMYLIHGRRTVFGGVNHGEYEDAVEAYLNKHFTKSQLAGMGEDEATALVKALRESKDPKISTFLRGVEKEMLLSKKVAEIVANGGCDASKFLKKELAPLLTERGRLEKAFHQAATAASKSSLKRQMDLLDDKVSSLVSAAGKVKWKFKGFKSKYAIPIITVAILSTPEELRAMMTDANQTGRFATGLVLPVDAMEEVACELAFIGVPHVNQWFNNAYAKRIQKYVDASDGDPGLQHDYRNELAELMKMGVKPPQEKTLWQRFWGMVGF